MLEEVIKELIESIDGLKKVMQAQAAEGSSSDKPKANAKTKKAKEVVKEEPIKEEKPASEAISKHAVSTALLALARQDGGRDKAIGLLKGYGAEKVSEVSEEDYAELLGKLQKAVGED